MRDFHLLPRVYLRLLACAILAACLSFGFAGHAAALDVPTKPTASPIVDNANILTTDQEASLAQTIQNEQTATGNQIGILTIPSLQGEVLEDYSIKVARNWGIGQKERNSGVLLLITVEEHQVRIEVGYGLEGALTDIRSGQIIRDRITPQFRAGNYYQGISDGLAGITTAIHGEADPKLQSGNAKPSAGSILNSDTLFFLLFLPLWLGSILARSKSWWAGGALGTITGVVIGLIFGFVFVGVLSIVGLALLGLLLDFVVSRNFQQRRASGLTPSWWAGGTRLGGGGSGGGGFGGFGGGGFGGGGASGSW